MRFRRRRRPRVQWLPNTGTDLIGVSRGTNPADCASAIEVNVLVNGADGAVVETPMVLDANPQEAEAGAALATIQKTGLNQNAEWGYRLRRIVGKYFVAVAQLAQATPAFTFVWVKQSIIVRRIDPETGLSLALSTGTTSGIDPTLLGNVSDPWVWQRSDFLSVANQSTTPVGQAASLTALGNSVIPNLTCGGTKDGPAVDIKTARRLGPEERLFHQITVQGLPLSTSGGNVGTQNLQLYLIFDYRVLGTISSAAGNRRNASR